MASGDSTLFLTYSGPGSGSGAKLVDGFALREQHFEQICFFPPMILITEEGGYIFTELKYKNLQRLIILFSKGYNSVHCIDYDTTWCLTN